MPEGKGRMTPIIRRSQRQELEDLRVAVALLFEVASHLNTCSWLEDHLSGAYPMHPCDCGYEEARVAAVKAIPYLIGPPDPDADLNRQLDAIAASERRALREGPL